MARRTYTIKELAAAVSITPQSIYNLKKTSVDFQELMDSHTVLKGRYRFYDEEILDFLKSYYSQEQRGSAAADTPLDDEEESAAAELERVKGELEAAKIECMRLQMEIDPLKKEIEGLRADKMNYEQQNAQLLLLLAQEKKEKMLFLPKPKKTLGERIKAIFKKEDNSNEVY